MNRSSSLRLRALRHRFIYMYGNYAHRPVAISRKTIDIQKGKGVRTRGSFVTDSLLLPTQETMSSHHLLNLVLNISSLSSS